MLDLQIEIDRLKQEMLAKDREIVELKRRLNDLQRQQANRWLNDQDYLPYEEDDR